MQPFHWSANSETLGVICPHATSTVAFRSRSGLVPAFMFATTHTLTVLPRPKTSGEALTLEVSHAEEEDAE